MWFFGSVPQNLFATFRSGGDKRDRTADPLLAKQVLSQLSYTPISLVESQGLSKLNNDFFRILLTLDVDKSFSSYPVSIERR